jgi:hypothetical protein
MGKAERLAWTVQNVVIGHRTPPPPRKRAHLHIFCRTQKRATQSQCLCGFLASGFGRVFCIGAKYDGFNAGSPIDDGPFL